jgi:hypothetical protein
VITAVDAYNTGRRETLPGSSAGFAGAIEGGRSGRGAEPPSGEIECHAHRHKEVTL